MKHLTCRFCGTSLKHSFVDLGMSPISNSFLKHDELNQMEPFYPLHVYVCENCYLVQLPEFQSPDQIFSDYIYFSSYSKTWLNHARAYVESMIGRFGFDSDSQVVEIASNDGYLLQYFKEKNIPVLGIEPAKNVAEVAKGAGIPTVTKFFGSETAKDLSEKGKRADLLLGNNVLAHVPDLNDFVAGMKIMLKPAGIITMEFPHLLILMEENQFDTIYHEHFSYLSLLIVEKVFSKHGFKLFDVEQIPTHGGSLRIFACHEENRDMPVHDHVNQLRDLEVQRGLNDMDSYKYFSQKVHETKRKLLSFLIQAKHEGKTIVGYGAPAKGNTILNYCGIRTDFIDYTVDRSPHKQNLYLPGTRIPIHNPDKIIQTRPDYLLILPWNFKEEIMEQMAYIRDWGGKFVVSIPDLKIYS